MKLKTNLEEQLILAAKLDNLNMMQEALGCGINCHEVTENGIPIFLIATRHNSLDCMNLLIERGIDIDALYDKGYKPLHGQGTHATALMLAAQFGQHEAVELLLNIGADPNIENIFGETALTSACHYTGVKFEKTIQLLINFGANVNHQDHHVLTALMNTVDLELSMLPIVKLLLDHGADPSLKDKNGCSFISLSNDFGNSDLIDYVLNYTENKLLSTLLSTDDKQNKDGLSM